MNAQHVSAHDRLHLTSRRTFVILFNDYCREFTGGFVTAMIA